MKCAFCSPSPSAHNNTNILRGQLSYLKFCGNFFFPIWSLSYKFIILTLKSNVENSQNHYTFFWLGSYYYYLRISFQQICYLVWDLSQKKNCIVVFSGISSVPKSTTTAEKKIHLRKYTFIYCRCNSVLNFVGAVKQTRRIVVGGDLDLFIV